MFVHAPVCLHCNVFLSNVSQARYSQDKEVNNTLVRTWRNGSFACTLHVDFSVLCLLRYCVCMCMCFAVFLHLPTVVQWRDIAVGDVVMITQDSSFPADLVQLKCVCVCVCSCCLYARGVARSSSHQGVCFIETANLDGETNLKTKQAIPQTYNIMCAVRVCFFAFLTRIFRQPDGLDYPRRFAALSAAHNPDPSGLSFSVV